jgi:hypothetical protein
MIIVVAVLLLAVLIFLFVEYRIHRHNLNSIPIRVHVNGTRGKCSATRLVAGALREHGGSQYCFFWC